MSQTTITVLRFQRSTSTPPSDARKNPGIMRALMTRAMAVSGELPPTRAVIDRTATSPIQSPSDDTTWASHSRKNDVDPSRVGPRFSSSSARLAAGTSVVAGSSPPGGSSFRRATGSG